LPRGVPCAGAGRLFTFESNGSGGRGEARHPRRAVGGRFGRRAAGGRGRWRDDFRIFGQFKPFAVANLEGGIVPQRALGGWAQAKLRGQLPEADNAMMHLEARALYDTFWREMSLGALSAQVQTLDERYNTLISFLPICSDKARETVEHIFAKAAQSETITDHIRGSGALERRLKSIPVNI